MIKVFLIVTMFLFSGCSFDSLIALTQVDKVQMVKKNSSMKHYRAYFTRADLKSITRGKKYLFFYNKRKKDLAILLRKKNNYTLYSIFHAHKVVSRIRGSRKTRYWHIRKALRKQGYRPTSPEKVGATVSVTYKRYKGIKTLRIDVRDYRLLQSKYRRALRTYNTRYVRGVRTSLPKRLIAYEYRRAKSRARTAKQKRACRILGERLHFLQTRKTKSKKKEVVKEVKVTPVEEEAPVEDEVDDVEVIEVPAPPVEDFNFYLHKASYKKLNHYLQTTEAKNELTYSQYKQLSKRNATLKEQDLLKNGSLETLIKAYKQNKKPAFKRRIMVLMKEAQKKK